MSQIPDKGDNKIKDDEWLENATVKPGPIFYTALAMGLVFIGIGTAFEVANLGSLPLKIFMYCVGFGLTLGAFGSKARLTIPGQSMTVVGVGALAVGIFFVISNSINNRYMRVEIEGDIEEAMMVLSGNENFLGSRQGSSFDFIIFNKDIPRRRISLSVDINGKEHFFKCIDASLIRPHLGSGEAVIWNYSFKDATLSDEMDNVIAIDGACRNTASGAGAMADSTFTQEFWSWFSFPTANAADADADAERSVDDWIEKLNSDSPYVRRDARSQLGKKGITAARSLLNEVQKTDITYREKLGVLVSLDEIAESQAGQEGQLKAIVDENDLRALTKASASGDDTTQSFATNVLINLKDSRVIPIVIQQLPDSSADGQYNLLQVLHQTLPLANDEQKQSAVAYATSLETRDEKTSELIKAIQTSTQ